MSAPLLALALAALAASPDLPAPPAEAASAPAAAPYLPAASAEERLETVAPPATTGSLLATGAAVVPGFFVHGAGHYVLGEPQAARELLFWQGVGLASFVAGFAVLASTAAAEQLAPLYVVPTVGGIGALSVSWLGDVVGSLRGGAGWPTAWRPDPGLTLAMGWDGLFASRLELGQGIAARATWRGERLRLSPSGEWHPFADGHAAGGLLAGWTLWKTPSDVTALELVVDLRHRRFQADGFQVTSGEAYLEGRADLGFFSRTLRNAWALGRIGWGVEAYGYAARSSAVQDVTPFLVMDIGMGLQVAERVGVEFAYRQRKNELPGGVMLSSGLAGFLGMVQLDGRVRVADGWALLPSVRLGSGLRTTLSLEARL